MAHDAWQQIIDDVCTLVRQSADRRGRIALSPEVAAQFAESAQRAAQQTALAEFAAYVAELERNAKVTRNSKVFE